MQLKVPVQLQVLPMCHSLHICVQYRGRKLCFSGPVCLKRTNARLENRQRLFKSARITPRHENHKNTACKQFKKQRVCEAKRHRMFRDLIFCWPVGGKKKRLHILAVLSLMEQRLLPDGVRSAVHSRGEQSPSRYIRDLFLASALEPDHNELLGHPHHTLRLKYLMRRTCYDVWGLLCKMCRRL